MLKFQFEANGKKLAFEAETVNQAFVHANKQFANLPQGAWFAASVPGVLGYRWQTGNFFD